MPAPPFWKTSPARVALVPVAIALAIGTYAATRYRSQTSTPPVIAVDADADAGTIACMQGFEPINGEGCLALPKESDTPPPLLVYLHGLYDSNAPAQEVDRTTRLVKRATARGFAVLAFRGRQGMCTTVPEYATWYCWPSNDKTADAGPDLVASWATALEIATTRTKARRRYVLGFSNGGYFAVLLATRDLFRADAFAIAGAGIIRPYKPPAEKVPIVLVSGDEDPSQPDMLALDQALYADKWPHDAYGREGGHALADSDIDLVLTFFTRSETEKVPLTPPIVVHPPRPFQPDGGAPTSEGEQIGPPPTTPDPTTTTPPTATTAPTATTPPTTPDPDPADPPPSP
jgi:poly(3-hydroxybutyrate) depolymerase